MMSGRDRAVKDCRETCAASNVIGERIRLPVPRAGRRCCDGLACRNKMRPVH
jgi:hypothetical protein